MTDWKDFSSFFIRIGKFVFSSDWNLTMVERSYELTPEVFKETNKQK